MYIDIFIKNCVWKFLRMHFNIFFFNQLIRILYRGFCNFFIDKPLNITVQNEKLIGSKVKFKLRMRINVSTMAAAAKIKKRKRVVLPINDKLDILKLLDKSVSHTVICEKYGIGRTTVGERRYLKKACWIW